MLLPFLIFVTISCLRFDSAHADVHQDKHSTIAIESVRPAREGRAASTIVETSLITVQQARDLVPLERNGVIGIL